MTKAQLSRLFNKYLLRKYNEEEWLIHGPKKYEDFKTELLNCEEYLLANHFKEKAESVTIKIAVASNKNFKDKSLPIVIPSLLKCGIERDNIHVFIGGYNEYKYEIHSEVHFHFLNHNSYEYSPLIEICEKKIKSDYWFLIHDTCKVGSDFKNRLYNVPKSLPDKIAMKGQPCMSIGLYKYSYLLSVQNKLSQIKNTDYSEASMQKWKDWGVWNEDYILFRTNPKPIVYPSKEPLVNKGVGNWYNTGTMRIIEYYPGLDLYKNKANWGQTNGKNGTAMIRTL